MVRTVVRNIVMPAVGKHERNSAEIADALEKAIDMSQLEEDSATYA